MPRKYVPKTPAEKVEGKRRRMRAHTHNSYHGFVSMSQRQMITILHSDSTTTDAKDIAADILARLGDLKEALATRVDEE